MLTRVVGVGVPRSAGSSRQPPPVQPRTRELVSAGGAPGLQSLAWGCHLRGCFSASLVPQEGAPRPHPGLWRVQGLLIWGGGRGVDPVTGVTLHQREILKRESDVSCRSRVKLRERSCPIEADACSLGRRSPGHGGRAAASLVKHRVVARWDTLCVTGASCFWVARVCFAKICNCVINFLNPLKFKSFSPEAPGVSLSWLMFFDCCLVCPRFS